MKPFKKSTWAYGIEKAYDDRVFVSPPVQGWSFIVGVSLSPKQYDSIEDEISPLLKKLSHIYGKACYFSTNRVLEFHVCSRALDGVVNRAYAYSGEIGEVLWKVGDETDAEVDIRTGCTEGTVMQIAEGWSISPITLGEELAPVGLGYLGRSLKASNMNHTGT